MAAPLPHRTSRGSSYRIFGVVGLLCLTTSLQGAQSADQLTAVSKTQLPSAVQHPALPQLTLVWCPPGNFRMGSQKGELGRFANEAPAETTLTSGFFLQSTELTQEQWLALRPSNPSGFPNPSNPVEMVNWEDAKAFCADLTAKSRAAGLIPADWRFDLPTEAQWEYACRAGTTSALNDGSNLVSKTGSDPSLDPLAWYEANSDQAAHPVAQKRPNAWGIYDMHGNLWEWCRDWFEFKLQGGNDPEGPADGAARVIRGGSWYIGSPSFCRSAYRSSYGIERRISHLGFRLALVKHSAP
jgi:formylglycine-generating enzyme required for sulfatase activity